MKDSRKPFSRSGLTLKNLEDLYFTVGEQKVKAMLDEAFGEGQMQQAFSVEVVGQTSYRTDAKHGGVFFLDYGPLALWQAPYSVQRVTFNSDYSRPTNKFIYHPGEEILTPIDGKIAYHFFFSDGQSAPRIHTLKKPLGNQDIIRLNPQVPHHTWPATEDGTASAWMIFRDWLNVPTSLVVSTKSKDGHPRQARELDFDDLQTPGTYALVAWGLSELIRNTRLQAGLSISELARMVDIDRALLARLESAKDTNIHLNRLLELCKTLRVGIFDSIQSGNWHYKLGEFRDHSTLAQDYLAVPDMPTHTLQFGGQMLHPRIFDLPAGSSKPMSVCANPLERFESWIVIKGRVVLDLPKGMGSRSVVVASGSVAHFRSLGETTPMEPVGLHALEPATVLVIKCAPILDPDLQ